MSITQDRVVIPGGYPGASPEEATQNAIRLTTKNEQCLLFAITDGETGRAGEQKQWVVEKCRGIYAQAGGKLHGPNDGMTYGDYVRRNVTGLLRGHKLRRGIERRGIPNLEIASRAKAGWNRFVRQRRETGVQYYQIGIPSPVSYAFLSGMLYAADAIADQISREICEILDDPQIDNASLIFLFEQPIDYVLGTFGGTAPRRVSEMRTRRIMRTTWEIINRLPAGTKVAFHLCGGDLQGQRLPLPWHSLRSLVTFANVLQEEIKEDILISFIHIPLGAGQHRLPVATRFRLKALKGLTLKQPETRVALGVAHCNQGVERANAMIRRAEEFTGRRFMRASMCGCGRHSQADFAEVCRQLLG